MEDEELYGYFTKEEAEKYAEEARQRWGHTEAYKQSQIRVKKMGNEGLKKVMDEGGKNLKEIVSLMSQDPKSEVVQEHIARHYEGLRAFYDPNPELYRGLADLYVSDERFKAFFEKIAIGLAQFMHDAMIYYADTLERKN